MARPKKIFYTRQHLIDAFNKNNGVNQDVCNELGISKTALYTLKMVHKIKSKIVWYCDE